MDRETPSSLPSSSYFSSIRPPFNDQQNQPGNNTPSHYNNGFNMQQMPNNNTNYDWNGVAIYNPYLYNNVNGHNYNNGYMMPVNVPCVNRSMVPFKNSINSSLNKNSYLEPSLSPNSSYNVAHTPQLPNVNRYDSSVSLHNASNTNCNNEYNMQSSSNNIWHNTSPMPMHINSPPTTIVKSPVNYLINKDGVSKKENVIKQENETKNEPEKVEEWFDMTSTFLNNQSNNTYRKHSASTRSDSKRTSNQVRFPTYIPHSKRYNITTKTKENMSVGIKEIEKLSSMTVKQIINYEKKKYYQLSPTNVYHKTEKNSKIVFGGKSTLDTCDEFKRVLGNRAFEMNALKPTYNVPRKNNVNVKEHKCDPNHCSSHHCSDGDSSSCDEDDENYALKEINRKRAHPDRLHPELWYNEIGEMLDGPLCKCSIESQLTGIQHNIYVGEGPFKPCLPNSNNADKLFHYRITITPLTNFVLKYPTIIKKHGKKFVFEGFSLLSHYRIPILPTCKVNRYNTNYTILYIEDKIPENFVVNELQLFYDYLFKDILELVDLDLHAFGNKDGCPQFHFMPRFVRALSSCNKEILSMNDVLKYLLINNKLLFEENSLDALENIPMDKWQSIVDEYKGMIVTNPSTKPCSIRVDQVDRDHVKETTEQIENDGYPVLVHFGRRPPQLSYAGNPYYQREFQDYKKFKYLLANMPKPSFEDKRKLELKEKALQELRSQNKMKRAITATFSSKGFYKTGLMCDIVQHAMLLPVLVCHLRFHKSLEYLEDTLNYKFKNKHLLQLAFTHPSYRETFGTNSDHARNTLANCGIRQPTYGDGLNKFKETRKKGINTLVQIMARLNKNNEMESNMTNNERLEFLGDSVVEFVTSIHLFFMFPDIEEGGLSTYRTAIVENQHLTLLAKTLKLGDYLLHNHGSDFCHDFELNHALANCFEALIGALFLDRGIDIADRVFGETLFKNSPELLDIWINYPKHPLQEQAPEGDRKWIKTSPFLQKLTKFEDSTGIKFKHIRLLARAFTDRSVGFTNLTLGSNQRLEFLGDTVLSLLVSEYLYKFFPEHHEGHLSLLRSSLVNNKTQSIICDELGMVDYAFHAYHKETYKTKDRADLLEAFLGALYIDKGLRHCEELCNVCFFPRLHDFILNQDWNDPKSKLQQCCLTLRSVDEGEPDTPVYKIIKCMGPANNRKYTIAVYFKGVKLAQANGHGLQEAEMSAAKNALEMTKNLFPQLDHQRLALLKSLKNQCSSKLVNTENIIKLVESKILKSESSTTKSDLAKRKLHRKLLAVLCGNLTLDDDDDDNDVDDDDILDNTKSEEISKTMKKI